MAAAEPVEVWFPSAHMRFSISLTEGSSPDVSLDMLLYVSKRGGVVVVYRIFLEEYARVFEDSLVGWTLRFGIAKGLIAPFIDQGSRDNVFVHFGQWSED
jgi:hypothetical protein